MSKKIVIASACRTAIGKMGGELSTVPAVDLGAAVIKEAVKLVWDRTRQDRLRSRLVCRLRHRRLP